MKKTIILITAVLLMFSIAQAQSSMESSVTQIVNSQGEAYLKGYMKPFVTAFGTAAAGATFHRAYTKSFPRLDIGISGVYISLPDEAKMFNFNGTRQPTVFGPDNQGLVGGTDLGTFFLPQLHLNLGLFANFELMARGFSVNVGEVGDISLIGFGVKYGLSDLVPLPILDISVQANYSSFNVGEWVSSGTFGMNLQASKGIPMLPLDVYAGIGFESTSMTLDTKALVPNSTLGEVSIDGDNSFRTSFGVSLTLLLLNIHLDYNIGEYSSLGGGLMVVF